MNRVSKGVISGGLIALAAISAAGGIKWNTSLAAALQIAKKSHRPVMVDFYGES
ncbi:MAG TPA: hypothetical protein VG820_07985 [Fimbriimonadaceae bacterium]|nr:hypothetical protein [Fimbriimonadaceae bacterium]